MPKTLKDIQSLTVVSFTNKDVKYVNSENILSIYSRKREAEFLTSKQRRYRSSTRPRHLNCKLVKSAEAFVRQFHLSLYCERL